MTDRNEQLQIISANVYSTGLGRGHWQQKQKYSPRKKRDNQVTFIHLSYYNRTPQTRQITNSSNLFFRFLEAGTRGRCQQMWCLSKAHFVIHRWLPFVESSHGRRDLERLLRTSFRRSSILTLRSRPQDLLTFPLSPPPRTITLQVKVCKR